MQDIGPLFLSGQCLPTDTFNMSLNHEFFVVESRAEAWGLTRRHLGSAATLHDDLVRYMLDSLAWIPSLNPSKRQLMFGLNVWGRTVITTDGAAVAGSIFRAWAQLFALSPARLKLQGAFGWIEDESNEAADAAAAGGAYERLEFERDDVCTSLRAIATQCDEVLSSDRHLCILHLGI